MVRQERTQTMGTRQDREGDGENAAVQRRIEELRGKLKQKQHEMDKLMLSSEMLHPSAYGALQGQLEEEIEKLQAELNSVASAAE
jgi:hypothetical protein